MKIDKLEYADLKYDNSIFKILDENYPNKTFLVKNTKIRHFLFPNLGIFIFPPNFSGRQIRGCWFQIFQYFFQIIILKYPNQKFFVSNLGILALLQKFTIRLIWGCWFQIWQYSVQIPVQKYPNLEILVPNLGALLFSKNFTTSKILGCKF